MCHARVEKNLSGEKKLRNLVNRKNAIVQQETVQSKLADEWGGSRQSERARSHAAAATNGPSAHQEHSRTTAQSRVSLPASQRIPNWINNRI